MLGIRGPLAPAAAVDEDGRYELHLVLPRQGRWFVKCSCSFPCLQAALYGFRSGCCPMTAWEYACTFCRNSQP
jgi:hypothetical protein